MENIKYREDGTPVIVVPLKLRHLGYKQTIVVDEQNRPLSGHWMKFEKSLELIVPVNP